MKAIFSWFGKHLLLLALIVGALMLHAWLVDRGAGSLADGTYRSRAAEAAAAIAEVDARTKQAAAEMQELAARSAVAGVGVLVGQKAEAQKRLHLLEAAEPTALEETRWAATGNVPALRNEAIRRLDMERLKREIEFYSATIELTNDPGGVWAELRNAETRLGQMAAIANQRCQTATQAQQRLQAFGTQGNALFRGFRRLFGEEARLKREAASAQDACFAAIKERDTAVRALAAAREAVRKGQLAINTQIEAATGELEAIRKQVEPPGQS